MLIENDITNASITFLIFQKIPNDLFEIQNITVENYNFTKYIYKSSFSGSTYSFYSSQVKLPLSFKNKESYKKVSMYKELIHFDPDSHVYYYSDKKHVFTNSSELFTNFYNDISDDLTSLNRINDLKNIHKHIMPLISKRRTLQGYSDCLIAFFEQLSQNNSVYKTYKCPNFLAFPEEALSYLDHDFYLQFFEINLKKYIVIDDIMYNRFNFCEYIDSQNLTWYSISRSDENFSDLYESDSITNLINSEQDTVFYYSAITMCMNLGLEVFKISNNEVVLDTLLSRNIIFPISHIFTKNTTNQSLDDKTISFLSKANFFDDIDSAFYNFYLTECFENHLYTIRLIAFIESLIKIDNKYSYHEAVNLFEDKTDIDFIHNFLSSEEIKDNKDEILNTIKNIESLELQKDIIQFLNKTS